MRVALFSSFFYFSADNLTCLTCITGKAGKTIQYKKMFNIHYRNIEAYADIEQEQL
jgi:hypothetical protein